MKLKTLLGPLFPRASSGRRGCGWLGGWASAGFPWRGTFLNIQNPSVLRQVPKGDQSHFEAAGASFVCEGCEVLPKWRCQFFKPHLQLTHGVSAFSFGVFGNQSADLWASPDHLLAQWELNQGGPKTFHRDFWYDKRQNILCGWFLSIKGSSSVLTSIYILEFWDEIDLIVNLWLQPYLTLTLFLYLHWF